MERKPEYCPSWFNIENYSICDSFSRYSWEYSILLRQLLINEISLKDRTKKNGKKQLANQLLINRLIEISSPKILLKASAMKSEESIPSFLEKEKSISDLSYCDLLTIYENLQYQENKSLDYMKDIIKHRDECHEMFKEEDKKLGISDAHASWINYFDEGFYPNDWSVFDNIPQYEEDDAHITVNLRNNDEDIINSFKEWLQNTRQKTDIIRSNRISDKELTKLSQFKILAYIDLFLWMKITDIRLTQYQIANLLYPNEFDIDIKERLKACTIPRATMVLNSSRRIFS